MKVYISETGKVLEREEKKTCYKLFGLFIHVHTNNLFCTIKGILP